MKKKEKAYRDVCREAVEAVGRLKLIPPLSLSVCSKREFEVSEMALKTKAPAIRLNNLNLISFLV